MRRFVWLVSICFVVGLLILVSALMAPLETAAQGGDWVWANYSYANDVEALASRGHLLWAGTGGGALRWDLREGSYTKYTPADGLVDPHVNDIAVDNQGRAWVGHDRGLSVCDETACTTYDKHNSGIPGGMVYFVFVASDGRVWLVSRDEGGPGVGVTVYNGATWRTYDTTDGLADDEVGPIAEDLDGHLWFGHGNETVSEFDGVSNWTIHYGVSLDNYGISGIAPDDAGNIWFITQKTAVLYDGTYWYRYYPYDPLFPYLVDIAVDGTGRPWVASFTGLWTFDGTNWTRQCSA